MSNDVMLSGYTDNDLDKLLEISRNNALSTANMIQKVSDHEQAIADLTNRMDNRELNELITPSQKRVIRKAVNRNVSETLGLKRKDGKLTPESKRVSKVYSPLFYSRIYGDMYERFDVSSYEEIRAIDFEKALEYAKTWSPADGVGDLKHEAEDNWGDNHPGESLGEYLAG